MDILERTSLERLVTDDEGTAGIRYDDLHQGVIGECTCTETDQIGSKHQVGESAAIERLGPDIGDVDERIQAGVRIDLGE